MLQSSSHHIANINTVLYIDNPPVSLTAYLAVTGTVSGAVARGVGWGGVGKGTHWGKREI